MANPSQEPPVSSKAPNKDLKDMDVLCTFKIMREPKFGLWLFQRPAIISKSAELSLLCNELKFQMNYHNIIVNFQQTILYELEWQGVLCPEIYLKQRALGLVWAIGPCIISYGLENYIINHHNSVSGPPVLKFLVASAENHYNWLKRVNSPGIQVFVC